MNTKEYETEYLQIINEILHKYSPQAADSDPCLEDLSPPRCKFQDMTLVLKT